MGNLKVALKNLVHSSSLCLKATQNGFEAVVITQGVACRSRGSLIDSDGSRPDAAIASF